MKKILQKPYIILLAVLVIILSVYFYLIPKTVSETNNQEENKIIETSQPVSSTTPSNQEIKDVVSVEIPKNNTITLVIENIKVDLQISEGKTFYETLLMDENKGKISFAGKEYSGMGFFITDIGTLHQGNGKYLVYYINNQEASAGVSVYVPKKGDVVRWEYSKNI